MGLLLFDTGTPLSALERHDLGFFVACLCTPLLGDDLGPWLAGEYTATHGRKAARP